MENKVEIIKTYVGKLGTITVTRYCEDGHEEFHVKHSHPALSGTWTTQKREAIAYAQFLAGKY